MNSIFLPSIVPPMSAIAILTASAPPLPSMSEYTPDMSVSRPILMVSPDTCACGRKGKADGAGGGGGDGDSFTFHFVSVLEYRYQC